MSQQTRDQVTRELGGPMEEPSLRTKLRAQMLQPGAHLL